MAYKQPSSGLPFKELGSSPARQETQTTEEKEYGDKLMERLIKQDNKRMSKNIDEKMKDPNWNQGKKRSEYTEKELEDIENSRYQTILSEKVNAEIKEKGDGSDKSGDHEGE